jgi:hypothetical protein
VWRITSIADINIDAVRKQKKAEYNKQYRLKRKLLLQQQRPIHDPVLSSLKMEGIFFSLRFVVATLTEHGPST